LFIARRGLKVKVMDQDNVVGPTSIEGILVTREVDGSCPEKSSTPTSFPLGLVLSYGDLPL